VGKKKRDAPKGTDGHRAKGVIRLRTAKNGNIKEGEGLPKEREGVAGSSRRLVEILWDRRLSNQWGGGEKIRRKEEVTRVWDRGKKRGGGNAGKQQGGGEKRNGQPEQTKGKRALSYESTCQGELRES